MRPNLIPAARAAARDRIDGSSEMTPDERSLLNNFFRDLSQAGGGSRDPEAERMINEGLRANPDGAYVLVQHAILSDQALHAAQARIADLERQASANTSFLGNRQAPPQTAVPPSGGYDPRAGSAQPQGYSPAPVYGQQAYAPPPPQGGLFSGGGGLGSFLRGAGTTAAGVAGGEMLFSGLSGLFGGHRGGGFWGGGGYGGGPEIENVTVNEYGDDGRSFTDDPYDTDNSDWSGDGN
jgi:hypothetical protein